MARFPNEKLVPVIEDLFCQLIDMNTEKESEKRRFKEMLIFFCRWEIKDISILNVLQSQEKLFKNRQRCHLYRHSCPWRKNSLNNHPAAYIITSKRCRQFIRPPPARRQFCFGQITPDNTVPARSTDYCTSRSHRRAARCVDYLPLIEHRYPITEAAGEIAL